MNIYIYIYIHIYIYIYTHENYNLLNNQIKKDSFICIDDVELNLQNEIIEAREYQYNLIQTY